MTSTTAQTANVPNGYRPQPAQAQLLDAAWDYVESVRYEVSARWLFYRLLQDGYVSKKGDYKRIIGLLSNARKRAYKDWRPWTLADDTRDVTLIGVGYRDVAEWLKAITEAQVFSYADRWQDQRYFVIVCFEAAAMAGQFDFYLPPFVPRVAFKGDVSIPAKWKIAAMADKAHKRYGLPVRLVYFGDLDPKGMMIPESAVADIETWVHDADFKYVRAGLNPGDDRRYGIAENPERPGTYQWEALDDDTAGRLIAGAIAPYIDVGREDELVVEDERRLDAFKDWWREYGPSADELGLT